MIGSVIQSKRKEQGLTQAQLAEMLGITAPAVNKWEKNLCCPDAALLAPLARILKTDINTLFSFYPALPPEEIDLILQNFCEIRRSEGIDEALLYMDDMLKQNITDAALYYHAAKLLQDAYTDKELPEEIFEKLEDYYTKALEYGSPHQNEILKNLGGLYLDAGGIEKALHLWEKLSLPEGKHGMALAHFLQRAKDYDAAAWEAAESILRDLLQLVQNLSFLADCFAQSGRKNLAALTEEKEKQLCSLFEIWEGLPNLAALRCKNEPQNKESLISCILALSEKEKLSASPLFEHVHMENGLPPLDTADLLANIMMLLQRLS